MLHEALRAIQNRLIVLYGELSINSTVLFSVAEHFRLFQLLVLTLWLTNYHFGLLTTFILFVCSCSILATQKTHTRLQTPSTTTSVSWLCKYASVFQQ